MTGKAIAGMKKDKLMSDFNTNLTSDYRADQLEYDSYKGEKDQLDRPNQKTYS